ncbi:MAG: HAMP domain-containing histidine kinase [Clostridia bacterium]|nr:HAMP domain-containing histidine kinase [Clostridia bacterium]
MKRKFFEKTYLLTLILFLVFLNVSIVALSIFTFDSNLNATEDSCIAENYAIMQAFENDAIGLGSESGVLLQISYGDFYAEKGIYLRFEEMGQETFSSIPDSVKIPAVNTVESFEADDTYYTVITRVTKDGRYTVTYAKDISYLYSEFKGMAITFIGLSVLASLSLAVLLYFILLKLYSPLSKLRVVAGNIADGDFSTRADESGVDELSALAKDFNRMADKVNMQMNELKTVAAQRQRMLDDLAHEMRTPLTVIHGYAEYIAGANISREEQIDASGSIMQEAMRLKSISEILLDNAFIREGKISYERIDTKELLKDVAKRYTVQLKDKNIEIYVSPNADGVVSGDKILLELLLSNLTDNAIKACKNGGTVELGAICDDGESIIYVRDNGVGMTEEELKHIKEPFYRADKSRSRRNGGTGLGLSLCETIAKAHGTELSFSSKKGEGTVAYLRLEKSYKTITD